MLQPSLKLTVSEVAIRPELDDKVALQDKLRISMPTASSRKEMVKQR
jgi:hypothetical protein